ncbi:hypothetical protein [Halotia branconii]|uniref:Uncharacterized protein n=1 Tax=Halotia branconii CENA392 TaxID=1539056 RepID=A0AAJ6NV12_9CYAN|nr:hypothetical protein [Halotia branconii]WGV27021.1 hypothetical protein QI031_05875 [Halotia branconii CENA392]
MTRLLWAIAFFPFIEREFDEPHPNSSLLEQLSAGCLTKWSNFGKGLRPRQLALKTMEAEFFPIVELTLILISIR